MRTGMWVIVFAAVALAPGPVRGALVNGDFGAGLTGWDTVGGVSDGGGHALLAENPTAILTTLSQEFGTDAAATALSFDYVLSAQPGGPTGSLLADAFQVSLLDPNTLAPRRHSPGVPDFFYASNQGDREFDASQVTVAGDTVTLNLTSLGEVDALLAFDLLGTDDGMMTTVQIDNVRLTAPPPPGVIPEPATIAMLALSLVGLLGHRRVRARQEGLLLPRPSEEPPRSRTASQTGSVTTRRAPQYACRVRDS